MVPTFVSPLAPIKNPILFPSVSYHGLSESTVHTCQYLRVQWTCSNVRPKKRKRGVDKGVVDLKEKEMDIVSHLRSLQETYGESMYMFQDNKKFDTVWNLTKELQRAGTSGPVSLSSMKRALVGGWRLVLTDDPAVLRNRGVTGLGKVLDWTGLKFRGIGVWLGKDGDSVTVEVLDWFGGRRGVSWLKGKWKLSEGLLSVSYEDVKMLWWGGLKGGRGAEMKSTWVGDKIRVGQAKSGSMFVFERDDEGWAFGEKRVM